MAIEVGADKIHPEKFENILQPAENLYIVIGGIDVKRVGSAHQVPVQPAEQRDLVGKEAIKVMLHMTRRIEGRRRAVGIVRSQLEAVQVLAGKEGLVTIEMLIVLDKYHPVIQKPSDIEPVL